MIFAAVPIYRIQTIHLDPLQLVLVGTVLEATCFLFEVPTGVVADTFSRRLSVIIGVFLIGAGLGLEGVFPLFGAVLVGQVISGIGYTFTSGATEAWIADEVGEEHLPQVFMRSAQFGRAGFILGIVVGVALASFQLALPIVLGGAMMMVLALFLVMIMPETGFKPTPREDRNTWQAMGHTFSEGVRAVGRQPRLITFLVIAAFLGMTSEGWDRLAEANYLFNLQFPDFGGFKPVVWLGAIGIVGGLLSMAANAIVRRRINTESREVVVRTVTVFTALRIAFVLLFSLAGNFYVAVLGHWGKNVSHSVQGALYRAWLTQSIDSRVRATVLSMTGQADAIGQIAGGPVIGGVGKLVSVRAALALSGLLLAPVLALYGRAHRQGEPEVVLEPVVASEA